MATPAPAIRHEVEAGRCPLCAEKERAAIAYTATITASAIPTRACRPFSDVGVAARTVAVALDTTRWRMGT